MLYIGNPKDRNKYVLAVKMNLQEKVKAIKDNFFKKPTGIETVQAYTRLIDDIIVSIYKTFSDNYYRQPAASNKQRDSGDVEPSLSLVAIGGYGRGELNIASDIDILFLYEKKTDSFIDYMASNVLSFLWDIGLDVGHSSRSISDCLTMARQDIESLTALMESRPIVGSRKIYSNFSSALSKCLTKRGVNRFLFQNIHNRKASDTKNIHSIFTSEPGIKESPGGLRDIHCALWATRTTFSAGSLEELMSKNIIDAREYNSLKNSLDLIFKVRNALHICTGKKNDMLAHEMQNKVTEMLGYNSSEKRAGVENLMRDFYSAAYNTHNLSNTLIHRCLEYRKKNKTIFNLFHLKELGKGIVQYKDEISLKEFNETVFVENPYLLFDIFLFFQRFDLKLSENLKRIIRKNLPVLKDVEWNSRALKEFFFTLLRAKHSAKIFRAMQEVDVLGLFLPEFEKCKYQIHNDFFHMYTVDEHCFQAVEKLENLYFSAEKELAEIASVYKFITNPEILKLSLLLHDIGKAEGQDHIQTGLLYIDKIAKRLDLKNADCEILRFLMKNHLLMNHIAQRRDLSDKNTISEFAENFKNIDLLKMLYIHTVTDIMAVSSGMWTEWKGALLWELYHKTYEYLMVDDSVGLVEQEVADNCKKEVLAQLCDENIDKEHVNYFLNNMPIKYFASLHPDKIIKHIKLVTQLDQKHAAIDYFQNEKFGFLELSVCARGEVGTLAKITGILSARSLNILSAHVHSGKDGLAINTLDITQSENTRFEKTELIAKISNDLEDVLSLKKDVSDIIKSKRLDIRSKLKGDKLIPTIVLVDNETSEHYTVIEIIFQDKIGSLYLLTKTFSDLRINIVNAKISTQGKRGLDVFYVANLNGAKIVDKKKIETIKSCLKESLE